MLLFPMLQLGAIAVAADAQGPIAIHHNPINIVATPAGERDGDCAALRLSMPGKARNVVHKFCRSARVYDMGYGVVIIDDNVNVSELSIYYARRSGIVESNYRIKLGGSGRVDSSSFVLKSVNRDLLKTELTLSFSGEGAIGPRTLGYRCITVDSAGMKDAKGKCR